MAGSLDTKFGLGLIGAGGFSHFSVEAFLKNSGISISGVYDVSGEKALAFAEKFNCRVFDRQADLLQDEGTDIVYINTPPFLHFEQSRKSLLAGKHVICEKPAALCATEVEELINIARDKKLLYVVNLMQRYNPLFPKIKQLVDEKLLGEFIHGYFENYASDENLDENHWMWDEKKSGGIFIEHAVHFFDLIEGWLGEGELVSSQKISRKGNYIDFWPEVQAICKYKRGLFNFYHGFHQADRMDRQELKLLFENGEISLFEWVPSRLLLKGLVSSEKLKAIEKLFPDGKIEIIQSFEGSEKKYRSHSQNRRADYLVKLDAGDNDLKYSIYGQLLKDMMDDQIKWLNDRNHQRKITEVNAFNSVKMAELANKSAIKL